MNESDGWSSSFPAQPGNYWFYGMAFYADDIELNTQMFLIRIQQFSNGIGGFCRGHLMSNEPFIPNVREGWIGYWKRCDLPTPPPDFAGLFKLKNEVSQ